MKTRRITANLPEALLREAQKVSAQGITETLILGLEIIARKSALGKAQDLKGKIALSPDRGRRNG
jgi:hypothetical protein